MSPRRSQLALAFVFMAASSQGNDSIRTVQQLYAQHRYQEAAKLAEQLVRRDRKDVEAWMALANVHLAPDWVFRHDARAESAAERALKLAGRRVDVLATLATAKYRQTKYDECLPILNELVDGKDGKPQVGGDALADLLVIRADIALKRDALDAEARKRALLDLDRAVAAAPASAAPRSLRAEARIEDGRYAEALADLEVAVAAAPGSKQVHKQLQTCLTRLGKKEEAKLHYEIWARLHRLTESNAAVSSPDANDRLKILRELRQLNPADLERRLQLAQAEIELGDPAAAIAECDELLSRVPQWPAAKYLRGEAERVKAGGARPQPEKDGCDGEDGGR